VLNEPIHLVVFDMAGTTVDDRHLGSSIVLEAISQAFTKKGLEVSFDLINKHRGKQKSQAIEDILNELKHPPHIRTKALAKDIYEEFLSFLIDQVHSLKEIEGTTSTFKFLKNRKVNIAVSSGFPTEIVDMIARHLKWKEFSLVDSVESVDVVGVGRPDPQMIYYLMERFNVDNPKNVIKVGDTVADIMEGKNAGVWTVAVLSGTQERNTLVEACPDFIINSIKDLPGLFGE